MLEKSKPKPQKVPARRVPADGMTVTVDDVEYRPHAGEWVEFRGTAQSVGDYLNGLELTMLQLDAVKPEDASEDLTDQEIAKTRRATDLFRASLDRVVASVVNHSLTDNDGVLYPSPLTVEAVMSMSFDEINWLGSGGRKKQDPLADESPSTKP